MPSLPGQKLSALPARKYKAPKERYSTVRSDKVHHWRTISLHRLNEIDQEDIASIASRLFVYFQYFDEFSASQNKTRERLHSEWLSRS
ncbi:hypothetical protein BH23PAT2_BH23PAT2_07020 [soil metagenome]